MIEEDICSKREIEFLRPSEVDFDGEFAEPEFEVWKKISELVKSIVCGRLPVEIYEPLLVFQRDGLWFTLNSQKLYFFRLLESANFLEGVRVKVENQCDDGKMRIVSSKNDLLDTDLRCETIIPHGPVEFICEDRKEALKLKGQIITDRSRQDAITYQNDVTETSPDEQSNDSDTWSTNDWILLFLAIGSVILQPVLWMLIGMLN